MGLGGPVGTGKTRRDWEDQTGLRGPDGTGRTSRDWEDQMGLGRLDGTKRTRWDWEDQTGLRGPEETWRTRRDREDPMVGPGGPDGTGNWIIDPTSCLGQVQKGSDLSLCTTERV